MSRIPPAPPGELTGAKRAAHDDLTEAAKGMFGDAFVYKRDDDAFVGPFAAMIQTPDVGKTYFQLPVDLSKLSGLPADARETAILTCGGHYEAAYEIYAHERVAEKTTDLSKEVVDQLKNGEAPEGLNEGCAAAYEATKYLITKPGPLPKELWGKATGAFGRDGALALVHYVGLYAYTVSVTEFCCDRMQMMGITYTDAVVAVHITEWLRCTNTGWREDKVTPRKAVQQHLKYITIVLDDPRERLLGCAVSLECIHPGSNGDQEHRPCSVPNHSRDILGSI